MVDSANVITNWTSPSADLDEVTIVARHGVDPLDLVFEDYEKSADLVHWATGDADDSPRGRALTQCYVRSMPLLEKPCTWNQRVVIQRSGSERGEVVHVVQAFGEIERSCERLIACVNEAWRGIPAPLPPGDDEYLTLEFAGDPCFLGEGMSDEDRRKAIDARESHARAYIESLATCDRQACRYNQRREKSCMAHLAALHQQLGAAP